MADSVEYLVQAENLYQHGSRCSAPLSNGYCDPIHLTKRPPLYSLFLGAILWVGAPLFTLLIFQNLLSLFNIFMMVRIMREWKVEGISIALGLSLFNLTQYIYANVIMSELLLQTWLLLLVFFISKYFTSLRIYFLGLAALVLVFAMLTKPVAYPLTALFAALFLWKAFNYRRPLVALWAVIPLLIMVAYSSWNEKQTGYRHFSSIQNINLVDYNTNFFLRSTIGIEQTDSTLREIYYGATHFDSFSEEQEYLRQQSTGILRNHFISYGWWHLRGALRGFFDPGRFDFYNFADKEGKIEDGLLYKLNEEGPVAALNHLLKGPTLLIFLLFLTLLFKSLLVFSWLGVLLVKKLPTYQLALIIFLPLYIALATGPLNASRFMLPIMPILVIGAAISLNQFFNRNWLPANTNND
ncbi:MAG: hypothetical protein EA409_07450 [Saprospirales bacterium]|nr:MAG: hypothetical protein EA409_07450 [Saprospirales bacterium]